MFPDYYMATAEVRLPVFFWRKQRFAAEEASSRLAESREELLERVQRQAVSVDRPRLLRAARHYGNVRTRKFFERTLTPPERLHAG